MLGTSVGGRLATADAGSGAAKNIVGTSHKLSCILL